MGTKYIHSALSSFDKDIYFIVTIKCNINVNGTETIQHHHTVLNYLQNHVMLLPVSLRVGQ